MGLEDLVARFVKDMPTEKKGPLQCNDKSLFHVAKDTNLIIIAVGA